MYLSSWSGGKDSCLALYRALKSGINVSRLVNFISDDHRRVRFHGVEAALIEEQSRLIGIPLYQKETGSTNYEECFKSAVESLKPIKGMVFGDIYLDEHREWVERVCRELQIDVVEPLWEEDTEGLVKEFLSLGFEAIVVGGQYRYINEDWIGKPLSLDFVRHLKDVGADICGENGEYHTFVTGGPIFKGRIILEGSPLRRDDYMFFDIKRWTHCV